MVHPVQPQVNLRGTRFVGSRTLGEVDFDYCLLEAATRPSGTAGPPLSGSFASTANDIGGEMGAEIKALLRHQLAEQDER